MSQEVADLQGAWSKKEQELAWRDRVVDDENVNCEDPFLHVHISSPLRLAYCHAHTPDCMKNV